MDSDLINVVVAVVVIYGLVRWWSKPGVDAGPAATANARPNLGFRPRNVTPAMIASVQNAFPQEPRANIHFDLLRTGNVQITCNTLIEKGFLPPAPAAFFQLYPQPDQPAPEATLTSSQPGARPTTASSSAKPSNLLERFQLDKDVPESVTEATEKPIWLDTPKKREDNLRERKAAMILQARQKLLEKQAKGKAKAEPVS